MWGSVTKFMDNIKLDKYKYKQIGIQSKELHTGCQQLLEVPGVS